MQQRDNQSGLQRAQHTKEEENDSQGEGGKNPLTKENVTMNSIIACFLCTHPEKLKNAFCTLTARFIRHTRNVIRCTIFAVICCLFARDIIFVLTIQILNCADIL